MKLHFPGTRWKICSTVPVTLRKPWVVLNVLCTSLTEQKKLKRCVTFEQVFSPFSSLALNISIPSTPAHFLETSPSFLAGSQKVVTSGDCEDNHIQHFVAYEETFLLILGRTFQLDIQVVWKASLQAAQTLLLWLLQHPWWLSVLGSKLDHPCKGFERPVLSFKDPTLRILMMFCGLSIIARLPSLLKDFNFYFTLFYFIFQLKETPIWLISRYHPPLVPNLYRFSSTKGGRGHEKCLTIPPLSSWCRLQSLGSSYGRVFPLPGFFAVICKFLTLLGRRYLCSNALIW